MKTFLQIATVALGMLICTARADTAPKTVSVAPKNDLSSIVYTGPSGGGFGSSVDGYNLSKEFEEGYKIGTKNDHFGTRNILMIDDGKSTFPATDKTTGLPIIVLRGCLKNTNTYILICTNLVVYWRKSAWPVIQAA